MLQKRNQLKPSKATYFWQGLKTKRSNLKTVRQTKTKRRFLPPFVLTGSRINTFANPEGEQVPYGACF